MTRFGTNRLNRGKEESESPPWTLSGNANCYRVEEANGVRVAYVYLRNNGSTASQADMMSRDGARRIASNIAKLPELVRGGLAKLDRVINGFSA